MSQDKDNKEKNPSGIWQATWAELFGVVNEHLINATANDFRVAWRTLLLLQVQIPPECQPDIKEAYKQAEEAMNFESYNKDKQLGIDAPKVLRNVIGAVTNSLFIHNWINKESGYLGIDPNKLSKDL